MNIIKSIIMAATISLSAQANAQITQLPAPDFSQPSLSVIEALQTRHSPTKFAEKELSEQELSTLLWAAVGVTRGGKYRTSPTAINTYEIIVYAFTKQGVYEYLPVENALRTIADGDYRNLVAGDNENHQAYPLKAPLSLVMVVDYDKLGLPEEYLAKYGNVDAGIVAQNINLYCQAVGLATRTRGIMDYDAISKLLSLNSRQLPVLNNTVGFPVEKE